MFIMSYLCRNSSCYVLFIDIQYLIIMYGFDWLNFLFKNHNYYIYYDTSKFQIIS